MFPVRTVASSKRALQMLHTAVDLARAVEKDDICIYSFTRTYGEMMPVGEFIRHMEKSIQMIEETVGKDWWERDDGEVIGPQGPFQPSS